MNKPKITKYILLAGITLALISTSIHTVKVNNEVTIASLEDNSLEAEYKDMKIYIGNKKYLESKEDTNAIKILDKRKVKDPDLMIYDSYKINNIILMNNIIDLLFEYESVFPSDWNRTKKSLLIEWVIHNALYNMDMNISHTKHVDFNNDDEELFNLKLLNK